MIRQGNGRRFVILEKNTQVGGTWNDNRYPGCCCDVWSHLYSLSYAPNTDWSREYSGQQEILEYLVGVATKYNLFRHIRFNTSVVGSTFDDATGTWTTRVRSDGGKAAEFSAEYSIRSSFLVSGVGQLNDPKMPSLKGLQDFQGKVMHSSRWDRSVVLEGKRVAVIGNGASAIQLIPEVAKVASQVVVFQRSANWILPRNDAIISPTRKALYRYLPFTRARHRAQLMDVRETMYNALFDQDGPLHNLVKGATIAQLNAYLPGEKNEKFREVLTPDYPPGCKRILVSDDFFPALARDNVVVETAVLQQANATSLEVAAGWNSKDGAHEVKEYDVDIIICATGFNATGFLSGLDIRNGKGESLQDYWSKQVISYRGITVPNFPNFGMLYGPNTNLGHNSIILMIEAQSRYINTLISKVLSGEGVVSLEPRDDVARAWTAQVQARLKESTMASKLCSSWYKTESGDIPTNWSETVVTYQKETSSVEWSDFLLTSSSGGKVQGKGQTRIGRVVEETQWTASPFAIGSFLMAAGIGAAWITRAWRII